MAFVEQGAESADGSAADRVRTGSASIEVFGTAAHRERQFAVPDRARTVALLNQRCRGGDPAAARTRPGNRRRPNRCAGSIRSVTTRSMTQRRLGPLLLGPDDARRQDVH